MLNFLLFLLVGWPAIVITSHPGGDRFVEKQLSLSARRRVPCVSILLVSEWISDDQFAGVLITVILIWFQLPDVSRARNDRLAHGCSVFSGDLAFVLCHFGAIKQMIGRNLHSNHLRLARDHRLHSAFGGRRVVEKAGPFGGCRDRVHPFYVLCERISHTGRHLTVISVWFCLCNGATKGSDRLAATGTPHPYCSQSLRMLS